MSDSKETKESIAKIEGDAIEKALAAYGLQRDIPYFCIKRFRMECLDALRQWLEYEENVEKWKRENGEWVRPKPN